MACVRVCPSSAVAVEDQDVWILEDTCVLAGLCLEACPHDAITVSGDLPKVRDLLGSGAPTVLVLSPEAAVHFHPIVMEQLVNAAYACGFATVQHGVMGEELVAEAYLRLWAEDNWTTLIRSTCPVLVEKIKKDYPDLMPYLAPVATPSEAEVGYLSQAYPGMSIVYTGVCLADAGDVADAALTFEELDRLFGEHGVDPAAQPTFHRRIPGERRRHTSTPGGMPLPVLMEERQSSRRFRKFRGLGSLAVIDQAVKDDIDLGFVDILPCEGCLDHPLLGPREQLFWRRSIAASAEPPRSAVPVLDPEIVVDVSRTFALDGNGKKTSEDDVRAVIGMIGTAPSGATWDCGACGFRTCRQFAGALLRGRAGLRQCPPYQERMASEAQREAAVDALTGLVTYRVLRDRLANEIARSSRSGDPFAVLFMDLDGFKQVNDSFGHRAGSDVLAAVGQVLQKAVRTTDVAGRYGGDEFVVLLVRTDVAGAQRVAEVIRGRVESVGRALGYGDGAISSSIGVAEYDPAVGNGGDVLERADKALYRAKAMGGNRIEV